MSSGIFLYNNRTITLTLSTYSAITLGSYGTASAFATVTTLFTIVCLVLYLAFARGSSGCRYEPIPNGCNVHRAGLGFIVLIGGRKPHERILSSILVAMLILGLVSFGALAESKPSWVREDTGSIGNTVVVYSTLDDAQQATVEAIWYNYYPDCTMSGSRTPSAS
jgi:hypothetical protein